MSPWKPLTVNNDLDVFTFTVSNAYTKRSNGCKEHVVQVQWLRTSQTNQTQIDRDKWQVKQAQVYFYL